MGSSVGSICGGCQLRRMSSQGASTATPTESSVGEIDTPSNGDRILVLRSHESVECLLQKSDAVLVRGNRCKGSFIWLTFEGSIVGCADLQQGYQMKKDDSALKDCFGFCDSDMDKFKRLCAVPLRNIKRLDTPQSYFHPKGSRGWHMFRESEDAMPPKPKKRRSVEVPMVVEDEG